MLSYTKDPMVVIGNVVFSRRVLAKIVDEIVREIFKTRSVMLLLILFRKLLASRRQDHRIGMAILSKALKMA